MYQTSADSCLPPPSRASQAHGVYLEPICPEGIACFRDMCERLFPITYSFSFYDEILAEARCRGFFVCSGALRVGICAFSLSESTAYLLVFGILHEFRNRSFGTTALQQLEQLVKHSYRVTEVLLHVQVNNVNAKGFYTGRGYALLST
ncbi:N-alpha-acetyltransferase 50, partial [Pancytospora philotis]